MNIEIFPQDLINDSEFSRAAVRSENQGCAVKKRMSANAIQTRVDVSIDIDPQLPMTQFVYALASAGLMLRSTPSGQLRISQRL